VGLTDIEFERNLNTVSSTLSVHGTDVDYDLQTEEARTRVGHGDCRHIRLPRPPSSQIVASLPDLYGSVIVPGESDELEATSTCPALELSDFRFSYKSEHELTNGVLDLDSGETQPSHLHSSCAPTWFLSMSAKVQRPQGSWACLRSVFLECFSMRRNRLDRPVVAVRGPADSRLEIFRFSNSSKTKSNTGK
jgi:hypothetical protein